MSEIRFQLPDDAASALRVPPELLEEEFRLAAAAKLYELRRLSSGAAARLAGVPKPVFLARLSDFGVNSFELSPSELEEDLANA
ncbi:MAG: UPF0175 family protein [Acidobacteriota bacterium]